MIKWIPGELHTHTDNSDGTMDLKALALKSLKFGLRYIALTDHNTVSGHIKIPEVMNSTGLQILYGMELTTFYGHIVALGVHKFIEWRDISIFNIKKALGRIHRAGGLAGMAHPYRIGDPVCTGCCWEYEIDDWSNMDYLEVWTEAFPPIIPGNKKAFDFWTQLLNRGYRITAVSGRDWHGNEDENRPIAVTYLGLDNYEGDISEKDFLAAVKAGRTCVTLGPFVTITLKFNKFNHIYSIGETVAAELKERKAVVNLKFNFSEREGKWKLDCKSLTVNIVSNKGIIGSTVAYPNTTDTDLSIKIDGLRWIRAEMYGKIAGIDTMIAFTNPIYFE
jgi:hypothetical protein